MIISDKQYAVAQRELSKLKDALTSLESTEHQSDKLITNAQVAALRSQIEEIEAELSEYDLISSGKISFSEASTLSELPELLIQARIARGYSQSQLAAMLDMKPQQIQRYEATRYMSVSLSRLIEIAELLGVKTSEKFESNESGGTGTLFSWRNLDDLDWSQFPIKEMTKRGWIENHKSDETVSILRDYFVESAGDQFISALHRKKVRGSSVPNKYALIAWQARVLGLAEAYVSSGKVGCFEHNDRWVPELVALTKDDDGPAKVVDLLAKRGIVFVTEKHLDGTHLDGAAMLLGSGVPVIALTLRYDRLDNFWFVLFHELGHVFLHLTESLRFDFFDDEESRELDPIEQEADQFALNMLIPQEQWDLSLSRFAMTEKSVQLDAKKLGISPSIIAGRIRKDNNDYMILNELVGQGKVRSQFRGD